MCYEDGISVRPQRIDELTRRDHYYLGEEDLCYYFLEYSARHGLSFGAFQCFEVEGRCCHVNWATVACLTVWA